MEYLIIAILGITLGGGAMWLLKNYSRNNERIIKRESTVLLERIEKVFKIVLAEGHFSEIHDFKEQSKALWVFNSTKKAILITNSKVLVGFDFSKFKFTTMANTRQITVDFLPEPEILSIDTDVKFYDLDANAFAKFTPDQLTAMQQEAKSQIADKVKQSHLFATAQLQLNELLRQTSSAIHWDIGYSLTEMNRQKEITAQIKANEMDKMLILPPNLTE